MFQCGHTIFRERIIRAILTSVTSASTDDALPEDGMTALKHVGAILV